MIAISYALNKLLTTIARQHQMKERLTEEDMAGHALSDDATILCLDWHGNHDQERSVVSGADPERASNPLV